MIKIMKLDKPSGQDYKRKNPYYWHKNPYYTFDKSFQVLNYNIQLHIIDKTFLVLILCQNHYLQPLLIITIIINIIIMNYQQGNRGNQFG